MNYGIRYLQFNDLVIDKYDMLRDYTNGSSSVKTDSIPLSFDNGSYMPMKGEKVFYEEFNMSMTIALEYKKLTCEDREFYRQFVISELSKAGKLWAVRNNELVWTNAVITSYAEEKDLEPDELIFDIDIKCYDGVWYKANKLRTFLKPFDLCTFMECYAFEHKKPCDNLDAAIEDSCCVKPKLVSVNTDCNCCECDSVTEEMALCYNENKLQKFYERCKDTYKIIYDCDKAIRLFGDNEKGDRISVKLGESVKTEDYYADTDIDSKDYIITVQGCVEDPYIEVNGLGINIIGIFDGGLTLFGNGEVWYNDDRMCCVNQIDLDDIIIYGDDLAFTFHRGNNKIKIETGVENPVNVYIDVQGKTI